MPGRTEGLQALIAEDSASIVIQGGVRIYFALQVARHKRWELRRIVCCAAVQSWMRGIWGRVKATLERDWQVYIAAAVIVQSGVRGALQRAAFASGLVRDQTILRAATAVQSYCRRYSAQQQLRHRKLQKKKAACATTVQSMWRKRAAGKTRMMKADAAHQTKVFLFVQSCGRRWLCRTQLSGRRLRKAQVNAALAIERTFRRRQGLLRRKELKQQQIEMLAALQIQRRWRGHVGQNVFLDLRLQQRRQDSALRLQMWWRSLLATTLYTKLVASKAECAACLLLQTIYRRHLRQRDVQQMRDDVKKLEKVLTVQRYTRARRCRRDVDTLRIENKRLQAAQKIQSCARVRAAKDVLTGIQAHKTAERSAVKIQSHYRRRLAQKKATNMHVVLVQVEKAVQLQTFFRSHRAHADRAAVIRDRKTHLAAVVLQAKLCRPCLSKRVARVQRNVTMRAKIGPSRIQRVWRGRAGRLTVDSLRRECKRAQLAISVQRLWRARAARRILSGKQAARQEMKAAVNIQRVWRGHAKGRVLLRKERRVKEEQGAALSIQRTVRGSLQRSGIVMARREALAVTPSATRIQTVMRQHMAVRLHANILQKRDRFKGARTIQCHSRRRFARKQLQVLKRSRLETRSLLVLQRTFRRILAQRERRKRAVERAALRLRSSVVIQNRMRIYLARKFLHGLRAERRRVDGATRLQTSWRMHGARKVLRVLQQEKRRQDGAVAVQRVQRGHWGRKVGRELKREKSATAIQKTYRGLGGRRRYQRMVENRRRERGANTMITMLGIVRAKKELRRRRLIAREAKEKKSATLLQATLRRCLAVKRVATLKRHRKERIAATVVQSIHVIFVARKELKRLRKELLQKTSAVKLQSFWRAELAVRHVQAMRLERRRHLGAVKLQAFWRAELAVRVARRLRRNRLENQKAVAIQSASRVRAAKKELKGRRHAKNVKMMILVQKMVRVLQASKNLQRMRFERAAAHGVMAACPGTAQGGSGWYQDDKTFNVYHFDVSQGGWNQLNMIAHTHLVLTKKEMNAFIAAASSLPQVEEAPQSKSLEEIAKSQGKTAEQIAEESGILMATNGTEQGKSGYYKMDGEVTKWEVDPQTGEWSRVEMD